MGGQIECCMTVERCKESFNLSFSKLGCGFLLLNISIMLYVTVEALGMLIVS